MDAFDGVRERVRGMMALEEWAKKHTPKGKVYKGIKFVPYQEKTKGGWMTMGWKGVPVFEKADNKPKTPTPTHEVEGLD